MSIPKYDELYAPFLRTLQDGETHSVREIRQLLAKQLHLTDEELAVCLPSGKQAIFANRVGRCSTCLKKEGWLKVQCH